ncbi:undecaprenyl-diphosphate phosphatase [Mucilaginibacter sp. UR6-11]|uniref:undecaprenyl-diphosphate phosphatase n=1 Tax=Mucilaginibacter sp. UR6-11 TaxID=1435644 RepID=UPI001E618F52|nr:undecaprenyl-diphosphate phosphatase [Mucilaginibacter sp. UR6-11]MCC8425323.1 undecaprenyl-diphosphate phosphatase [Mucilaginibacter sp. UR6-11]
MNIIHVIVLAVIEGLTEFLPVSSTGHLVVASAIMGIGKDEFVKLFEIVIQLGAILAVVVLYFKRFFRSVDFYIKLIIGVIPAVIFGLLLKKKIDILLESPLVVAVAFVIGGVILLFVDEWFNKPTIDDEKEITYLTALKIGLFQCLAMVPGVSRSGASIVGGMTQKLSRKAAAEFSFFLAVPTMFGATLKDLYDFYKHGNMAAADLHQDIKYLLIGSAIAFIVALLAIKSFITFLEQKGFRLFGIYRILAGIVIIILYYSGNVLHTV